MEEKEIPEKDMETGSEAGSGKKKIFIKKMLPFILFVITMIIFLKFFIRQPYIPPQIAFKGSSNELRKTIIVPTLDSPITPGKNVIWCSSFQLAWNKLKNDIAGEPVQVKNGGDIVELLNNATETDEDISKDSFYAAIGPATDKYINKIRREMSSKFPQKKLPDLHPITNGIITYSYLQAKVEFTMPFFSDPFPTAFQDSHGTAFPTRSFGIRREHENDYLMLRDNVDVLHYLEENDRGEELIIDPCNETKPNQIILALIPPGKTLKETLDIVDRKIAPERLRKEDIKDWQGIIRKLKAQDSLPVRRIWSLLDKKGREAILHYKESKSQEESEKKLILKSLNKVIDDRNFYEKKVFEGMVIHKEVEFYTKDIGNNYSSKELEKRSKRNIQRLNRRLMESIFQEEIAAIGELQKSPLFSNHFGAYDILSIPCIYWDISHHFSKLEGPDKTFQNRNLRDKFIASASQAIQFKLDRGGADLASEGNMIIGSLGYKDIRFNRPFLVIMKKRDAENPFFVMWVENNELLSKW